MSDFDPTSARHMRLAAAVVFAGVDNYTTGRDEDFVAAVLGDLSREEVHGVVGALAAMVANSVPEEILRELIRRAAEAEFETEVES